MRPLNTCFIVLLTLLLAGIIATLWLEVDVSVRSSGIIRPVEERTELRPAVSGIIRQLLVKEGQAVKAGQPILTIHHTALAPRQQLQQFEINQRRQYLLDLQRMVQARPSDSSLQHQLQSPQYRQQWAQYQYRLLELQSTCRRTAEELRMADRLLQGKVIAAKEHFDKVTENERAQAALQAFQRQQLAAWEQQLQQYRQEHQQYLADQQQLQASDSLYTLRAPVSGIVQGIASKYAGGVIQAGETVCTISPESALLAECYVNTRDAGLLHTGQRTRFQIDAFDYNYFGTVDGTITRIDNDFTLVNNQPVFKVHCRFDRTQLPLRNGFTAHLKKGLTLQARFLVARRRIGQLLWDTVDDWMNPAAPMAASINPLP